MMDVDLGTKLLIMFLGNFRIVSGEIDVYLLTLVHDSKAVDMMGIGIIVVTIDAVVPFGIVASTDMHTQTDALIVLHLLAYGLSVLRVYLEQVANLLAVFDKEVIEAHIPSAHHDMLVS